MNNEQPAPAVAGRLDQPVRRRWRAPTAKPGELVMRWGKVDGDRPEMCYAWGEGASKRDMHLLHMVIASQRPDPFADRPFSKMLPSLLEDLEARGYDLTTLRFSVSKKQAPNVI